MLTNDVLRACGDLSKTPSGNEGNLPPLAVLLMGIVSGLPSSQAWVGATHQ